MRWGAFGVLCAGCGFQLTAGAPLVGDAQEIDGVPGDITHGENGQPAGPPFLRMIDLADSQIVGGPHTNFPVLISLTQQSWLRSTANGGRIANANGSDLWFSLDAAGTVPMPHEISDAQNTTIFGNRVGGDRTFDGNLDEARASKDAKSAGWIETTYKSQREPMVFATVGPEL